MKTNKFIIPQNKRSIIAEYDNNHIKEIGKIDIPYLSKSVFIDNRLIISICFGTKLKNRRLKIFDEYGNQLLRKTELKFESINFKDSVVYLGGQYIKNRRELFSFIDFSNVDFIIDEIKLPVKSIEGKSIDDILIRNNTLYLVDNIVFPKYIFEYNINIPNNPNHIGTYELENNGTYEHIKKGDINDNWIILFSSTVGMGGSYQHISIIGKENKWNNQNVLHFCTYSPLQNNKHFSSSSKNSSIILDICIIEDSLLVLKKDGLYSIELTGKNINEDIKQIDDNRNKYNKLIKINNEICVILNAEKYELLKL